MFVDDFMSMEKIQYTHKVDNTVIAGRVLRVEERIETRKKRLYIYDFIYAFKLKNIFLYKKYKPKNLGFFPT